jgi:hypothetical protein
MKKKLKIDFLKRGSDIEAIAKIVANHNGGINPVSLEDICSYLWVLRSIHELNKNKDAYAHRDENDPDKLWITEDGGKSFYCTIEEIEVHELDDIKTPADHQIRVIEGL